ncbi:MAG: hypothetical protein Q4C70_08605 [Planctomycetia bacterium]|nr:hypothetical protein [Planctomycetia bacterium]
MFFRRFCIQAVKNSLIAFGCSFIFAVILNTHTKPIPILQYGLYLFTGYVPVARQPSSASENATIYFTLLAIFILVALLGTYTYYRAGMSDSCYKIIEDNITQILNDKLKWEQEKTQLLAKFRELENAGELVFPPWRENSFSNQRTFYLQTLYAYQVYKDPERRARQKHLAESLKHV